MISSAYVLNTGVHKYRNSLLNKRYYYTRHLPTKPMTREEELKSLNFMWTVVTILWVSLLFMYIGVGALSVDASNADAFRLRLDSGVFADSGENTPFVDFVMRMVGSFLQNLLPVVSILTFTFTLITLIATVLYLLRTDLFDEIYMAKAAYKAEKAQSKGSPLLNGLKQRNIYASGALQQYGFLKCCVYPNLKAIAFFDASQSHMTLTDFFKVNGIKFIMVFALAMMIADQTMLDLFYTAGSIGSYFVRTAVYDYDYVSIIDGMLTAGSDYSPTWSTKTTEGKNKTKVYNAAYKVLKTGCTSNATRTSAFKEIIGRSLMEAIEGMVGVDWERTSFIATAELLPNTSYIQNVPGESYYYNVADFGFTSGVSESISGYIHISIITEEETFSTGVVKTLYPEAWSVGTNTATFDVTKIYGDSEATIESLAESCIINYSRVGNIKGTITYSGSTATLTWEIPSDAGDLQSITFTNLKITGANGTKKSFAQITYKGN